MALIPCPACGKQVSAQAPTCPQCGHPIAGSPPPPPQQTIVVKEPASGGSGFAGCLLLLLLLGGGAFYLYTYQPELVKQLWDKAPQFTDSQKILGKCALILLDFEVIHVFRKILRHGDKLVADHVPQFQCLRRS